MADSSRAVPRLPRWAFLTLGLGGIGALGSGGIAYFLRRVNSIHEFTPAVHRKLRGDSSNALFAAYPRLADRLPWRPLGTFPTPIEELPAPVGARDVRLFVKRDDQSAGVYGGNKVRKLEYFLAEAELASRRTLITLGGIGSNHALAVAIHGKALGFDVDLALYDQPITPFVRRNLGAFLDAGARLHYGGSTAGAFLTARRLFSRRAREGRSPYFIMVGGTSRLGCIGHVNAALELAHQIEQGLIPEPDRIFVPLGTCGTAAGLIAGLRLAGLRTRVAAVRVADPFPANAFIVRRIAQDAVDFLRSIDSTIPPIHIVDADFDVLPQYFGSGYGFPTAQGEAALRWVNPQLALETTYTGKTLAACLDYCREAPADSVVLFWNTFSSAPVAEPQSWAGLPGPLQRIVAGAL